MNSFLGLQGLARFVSGVLRLGLWVLLLGAGSSAWSAAMELQGRWFEQPAADSDEGRRATPTPPAAEPKAIEGLSPTGGRYRYEARFEVQRAGYYVIDFKNSSVLGRFEHRIEGPTGALPVLEGGIQSDTRNPFLLRHGRELWLEPGTYQLTTRLEAPFFLAQPEPYLEARDDYLQAIKPGNALVLLSLGLFIGLGVYYAVLAAVRRHRVHAMYAFFILGNLLYNGTALLVFNDLLGWNWFYLISVPILFSNIAYVVFVMSLLDIRPDTSPALAWMGRIVIGVMALGVVLAAFKPNWSLEIDRVGVGLFLIYGLGAGLVHTLRGNPLARWYLLANAGFFATGAAAISLVHLQGVYAIYIEHLGLLAVAIEVLLLALVLSYQFGVLWDERQRAFDTAERHLQLACTDTLTKLPNRYALEIALSELPAAGGLTYIDLDGLKYYNDRFGHERGDRLLCEFSRVLSEQLGADATLHRLGGDEFAVTVPDGRLQRVERLIEEAIAVLRRIGYELSGASCGSVHAHECSSREQLKHLADTRMYENKRKRRLRDLEQPLHADPA